MTKWSLYIVVAARPQDCCEKHRTLFPRINYHAYLCTNLAISLLDIFSILLKVLVSCFKYSKCYVCVFLDAYLFRGYIIRLIVWRTFLESAIKYWYYLILKCFSSFLGSQWFDRKLQLELNILSNRRSNVLQYIIYYSNLMIRTCVVTINGSSVRSRVITVIRCSSFSEVWQHVLRHCSVQQRTHMSIYIYIHLQEQLRCHHVYNIYLVL